MKKKLLLTLSTLLLIGSASARPWYPPVDDDFLEFTTLCITFVSPTQDEPC